MKKILIFSLVIVFPFTLFSQERELSNYEKYRIEKEKEEFNTSYEQNSIKNDTIYIKKESKPIVINNYYIDNEPNLRFNLTFGYTWRPYCYSQQYGHYSWYSDPYYFDSYWFNRYLLHYDYYPYYITKHHRNYPYYIEKHHKRYYFNNEIEYYKLSNRSSNVITTNRRKSSVSTRNSKVNTQKPKYSPARTPVRNEYNRPTRTSRSTTITRTNRNKSTYTRPNTSTQRSTRSSTYSRPSSSNRSKTYSTPSRNSSRSSTYSRPSTTRSSATRSSSSSSRGRR